eukprot:IDg11694t1
MLRTTIGSDHNVVTVAEEPTAQQFVAAENAHRSAARTRCSAVKSSLRKGGTHSWCVRHILTFQTRLNAARCGRKQAFACMYMQNRCTWARLRQQGCCSTGARTQGSAAHCAATCRHYGSISSRVYIAVTVDDFCVAASNMNNYRVMIADLLGKYQAKDIGPVRRLFDWSVRPMRGGGLHLSQPFLFRRFLDLIDPTDDRAARTPQIAGLDISPRFPD